MARNPRKPIEPSKKHLARIERENLQRRYILITSAIVIILVLGVIGYGVLDQTVLRSRRPVATVNGEGIATSFFQEQTRYARASLINQAMQTYQFMQMFGSDPQAQAQFGPQLSQISVQLTPTTVGQQTIDTLISDKLIRQEAVKRGITITPQELDQAFQEAFGYYANGTPTPSPTAPIIPTSTLSPLQMTLVPPTPTPTATPVVTSTKSITSTTGVTATATSTATVKLPVPAATISATRVLSPTAIPTPSPTATPYTLEGYKARSKEVLDNYQKQYGVSEATLRYVIESQLLRQKVEKAVIGDLPRTQEQVWARHILFNVSDPTKDAEVLAQAKKALADLQAQGGKNFAVEAALFSTDTSNKDKGGDLGWFSRGRMVPEFENVAFSLKVGEIVSQPVKTQFGYHIIQVLGHENRPLTDQEYQQLQQQKFQEWLDTTKKAAKIDIQTTVWQAEVPKEPTLPAQLQDAINAFQNSPSQKQPQLPVQPSP